MRFYKNHVNQICSAVIHQVVDDIALGSLNVNLKHAHSLEPSQKGGYRGDLHDHAVFTNVWLSGKQRRTGGPAYWILRGALMKEELLFAVLNANRERQTMHIAVFSEALTKALESRWVRFEGVDGCASRSESCGDIPHVCTTVDGDISRGQGSTRQRIEKGMTQASKPPTRTHTRTRIGKDGPTKPAESIESLHGCSAESLLRTHDK